jgi:hypothetical protein
VAAGWVVAVAEGAAVGVAAGWVVATVEGAEPGVADGGTGVALGTIVQATSRDAIARSATDGAAERRKIDVMVISDLKAGA